MLPSLSMIGVEHASSSSLTRRRPHRTFLLYKGFSQIRIRSYKVSRALSMAPMLRAGVVAVLWQRGRVRGQGHLPIFWTDKELPHRAGKILEGRRHGERKLGGFFIRWMQAIDLEELPRDEPPFFSIYSPVPLPPQPNRQPFNLPASP